MAEKANPFAKLGKTEAPASRAKSKAAAAASEEVSEEAASEEEVVAAAKERVAAKRATRSVKAKAAPEVEEIEEVEEEEDDSADSEEVEAEKAAEPEDDEDGEAGDSGDGEDDHAEEGNAAAVSEPVKAAPKRTRRTAKQVEEEYQAKQAELEAQIAKLTARIESGDVEGGVEVVKDRVVLEDGVGGDLRVVGASRTLVNDDWRATVTDGIKLVVGRSSAQATNSFVIPVSLAKSLGELLAEIDEIAE